MVDRPPLQIFLAAAQLGLLADLLLRGTPWGVNLALCVLVLAVSALVAPEPDRAGPAEQRLLWCAVGAALAVAWRDAPLLVVADSMAAGGLLVLALMHARGLRLGRAPVRAYLRTATRAVVGLVAEPFGAVTAPSPDPSPAFGRRARAVVVGVTLALPISAVFGVLLAAADPLFERAMRAAFMWNAQTVASHTVVTAVFAWLALGVLVGLVPRPALPASAETHSMALGLVELGIPLGALAALFAVFIGFQVPYFFGGASTVLATAALGYADYARRGFFELVTVTALVVPVLVSAGSVLDRSDPRAVRGFRILACALLGLVSLIAGSALYRLWLYYGAYGLTSDRLYAAAVMGWVGLVLGWFALTVVRGRPGPFVAGALVSGLGVLACLNLVNPDGLVARVNLARGRAGAELDVTYLGRLSADAVPALAAGLADLPLEARCELTRALEARWRRDDPADWRTWNVARSRAVRWVGRWAGDCGWTGGSADGRLGD